MSTRTPKENLKSFSWVYIVLAAIYVIAAIVCNFVPDIAEVFVKYSEGTDLLFALNVTAVVNILIYLWYFWLARRVADGKSNGTLYMILLILGIAGAIVSVIMAKSISGVSTADFIANVLGLYYLYKARTEE